MKNAFKFLLLVIILNVIRYTLLVPIEAMLIFDWHDRVLKGADYFNYDFSTIDWATSFFYNFMMWFIITYIFSVAHPILKGNMIISSLKVYGMMYLFFVFISAVYMNHYQDKEFHIIIILDGLITFSMLAVANGLIYPLIFKKAQKEAENL